MQEAFREHLSPDCRVRVRSGETVKRSFRFPGYILVVVIRVFPSQQQKEEEPYDYSNHAIDHAR